MHLEENDKMIIRANNGEVIIVCDANEDIWIYADKKMFRKGKPKLKIQGD